MKDSLFETGSVVSRREAFAAGAGLLTASGLNFAVALAKPPGDGASTKPSAVDWADLGRELLASRRALAIAVRQLEADEPAGISRDDEDRRWRRLMGIHHRAIDRHERAEGAMLRALDGAGLRGITSEGYLFYVPARPSGMATDDPDEARRVDIANLDDIRNA